MGSDIAILISSSLGGIISVLLLLFALILIYKGINVVPQSSVFVIERFGKYTKTLNAGLNFIIPFLDNLAHKISILERQLPQFKISVITKDNVEVTLEATVFYRIIDAAASVYRIQDIDLALHTASESIIRSGAGKLELDDLQSSRESMNEEIAHKLQEAATIWGIEITRTEITDVVVDDRTKESQRQQLNAERERRATIAKSEGEKRSVELAADARLYEAERAAEAVRIAADAEAYAIKAKANADAEQTRVIATAISDNGQPAIDFEIMKRQVDALAMVGSSSNSKTVIMPTNISAVLGSLEVIVENLKR
jgi:regulator of protease activity HflC (stomatin/prohibitin superfamily)